MEQSTAKEITGNMMSKENIRKNTELLGGDFLAHEIATACEYYHENCDLKNPENYSEKTKLAALAAIRTLQEYNLDEPYMIGCVLDVMERLANCQPLSPITEDDFDDPKSNGIDFQCQRYSSLFKCVEPNGKATYIDVDRCICINVENEDETFSEGFVDKLVDKLFPITLPYYPNLKHFEARVSYWPIIKEDDTRRSILQIHSIKEPTGVVHKINRMWQVDSNGEYTEILTKEDILYAYQHREGTRLQSYASYMLGVIDDFIQDIYTKKLKAKYGYKFSLWDLKGDDLLYDPLRKYQWVNIWDNMFVHNKYDTSGLYDKIMEGCEPMMREKEPHIWTICEAIMEYGEDWLKNHSEYRNLYATAQEIVEKAKLHFDKLQEKFEECISRIEPLYEYKNEDEKCDNLIKVCHIIREYCSGFTPDILLHCWEIDAVERDKFYDEFCKLYL